MDRRTRATIDRLVAEFSGHVDGRVYTDELGPAVYRIDPPGHECIALACMACRTVTIRPGSPRLAELAMACQQCGRSWDLRPPADVLAFGRSGLQVVTGPALH